jgi:DNA modification methylase
MTLEKNKLICGDNLGELVTMEKECVDLIYIDPPFFSNRNYEIIWGDEAEIRSFEDRWEGGINVYVDWMKQRVMELYRVLKPTGSFFLHCDWHSGHYLKVMLDEVFGTKYFQNEIIWSYRTGGASKRRYSRKHDTIFFYTKSNLWTFNVEKIKSYQSHKYGYKLPAYEIDEETGRQYSWVYPRDVWEITMGTGTGERWGYPTQKPEALLEQIIKVSSNESDIVLDAFCGCGTTLAVAQKLRRRWIGVDISPSAIALIKNRLANLGIAESDIDIIGMPKSKDDLKKFKPYEFQYWVINELHGSPSPKKTGDMGIDGFSLFNHYPIQVKQQEGVGRNVIDNFETALKRYYKTPRDTYHGYIVAFSFTKGAYEEVARVKREGVDIELIEVQDILDKKVKIRQEISPHEQNNLL